MHLLGNYAEQSHVIFYVAAVQMSIKISVLILLKDITVPKSPR